MQIVKHDFPIFDVFPDPPKRVTVHLLTSWNSCEIKKKLRIFLSSLNIGQIMSKIDSFTNWSTTEIVGTYSVFQQFQPIIECLEMIRKKIEL